MAENTSRSITTTSGSTLGVFWKKNKYLHISVPLPDNSSSPGAIAMTFPLLPIWQDLRQNQKIILAYILANTLILSVIGFFRFFSIIFRPIERLAKVTSNYGGEHSLTFISEKEGSEFQRLSSAINNMVQRIDEDKVNLQKTVHSLQQANETIQKTQQEMVRAEKLASVGRLSAGLAHEIGNPLGIVLGYLGLLRQDKLSPDEKLEYIRRSEEELNRINSLVRQLLDFSRPVSADQKPVHVHKILLSLQQILQEQEQNKNYSFVSRLDAKSDTVCGSEEVLRQAFFNFFLNARDAVHETLDSRQGIIETETRNIKNQEGNTILQITISDNGSGISPAHLANIFDPFFTTKDPGKGTGLGLSVSHTIIDNIGGTLRAQSIEGESTSIIIKLPILDQAGN